MSDRERIVKQIQASELRHCQHFNGIGNDCCKAGVKYADVSLDHAPVPYESRGYTYTRTRSWPCFVDEKEAAGRCASVSFLTSEEARAKAERRADDLEIMMEGARRAHEASKGVGSGTGFVVCPKCDGRLHWSKAASNGHVWGKCETQGCLAWVE